MPLIRIRRKPTLFAVRGVTSVEGRATLLNLVRLLRRNVSRRMMVISSWIARVAIQSMEMKQ